MAGRERETENAWGACGASGASPSPNLILSSHFFKSYGERDLNWAADAAWTFTTTFDAPASMLDQQQPGTVVDLVLDGVDTVARVSLNGGAATAACASAHAPCVLRGVQAALRPSGNTLEVAFLPAEAEAAARAAAYPYKVPFVKVRER